MGRQNKSYSLNVHINIHCILHNCSAIIKELFLNRISLCITHVFLGLDVDCEWCALFDM